MYSPSSFTHRRRSHSASSPIPRRQPDDVKWRLSTKRSRPSSIRSPSYKDFALNMRTEKWDVDQWRRGKRARTDSNTEDSSDDASHYGMPASDPISPTEQTPEPGSPSTSRLPCTSAAFQFFPQKKQRRHPRSPPGARLSREASPRAGERLSSEQVRRMRAEALGELHRSVAEGGEGLVRRMRDWERIRHRSPRSDRHFSASLDANLHLGILSRRLTPPSTPQAVPDVADQSEDDDDDLFIVGEAASLPVTRSPVHMKRARSLSMMDVDLPDMETHTSPFVSLGSDRCSSPIDRSSDPSAYSSDDEGQADMDTELSSSGIFSTPLLSHTYSVSSNSSLVSLPLSQACDSAPDVVPASASAKTIVPGSNPPPSPAHLPSTASRSEKAIAALTLAMANGAAGISDYEALRMTEELTTLDESHVGELWS